MSLFTSSQFASASAAGTNWRDTSKAVLELLEGARTAQDDFNFGFLYITDHLTDDATSIFNLFCSVLNIENWVGCVGMGICANGKEYIDEPAISAMIGHFDARDFCIFPAVNSDRDETGQQLTSWLDQSDPMLVFVHGDPMAENDPRETLMALENLTGGFLTGGMSSTRNKHIQFANDIRDNGVSGAIFSSNVKVATALSQGCTPLGPVHNITRGHENIIMEMDEKKAVEVFEADLRAMAAKKIEKNPDDVQLDIEVLENPEAIPEEFKHLFKGEVHVAFPISQSDQQDYLVRNIIGLDPDESSIRVTQTISSGERVMFVHRSEETLEKDLCSALVQLRERVQKETGSFEPKAALYVSCVARAFTETGEKKHGEMKLVHDIIGDVPLTGFYAGGEISNGRIYGYTGILTLFL